VRRAERGVARISAKGCRVGRDVGGGEGGQTRGGESGGSGARGRGRRLRDGGILPY
jgi:hypothetical protein